MFVFLGLFCSIVSNTYVLLLLFLKYSLRQGSVMDAQVPGYLERVTLNRKLEVFLVFQSTIYSNT